MNFLEDQYHEYKMKKDFDYNVNYTEEMKKDFDYNVNYTEEMKIPLDIQKIKTTEFYTGSQSLVWVGGSSSRNYPLSFGNYWSMVIKPDMNLSPIEKIEGCYPVLNIWCENWEEAVKRFNITELNAYIVNGLCVITNKEIPDKWYLDELFMRYNLHRGMDRVESDKLHKWYGELK